MAVVDTPSDILTFEDWYIMREEDRDGVLAFRNLSDAATGLHQKYDRYKREMDMRLVNFENLEKLADNEVISAKPDLPNVSSGETSGIVRRIARNLVQNTPNLDITCVFDDKSPEGVFAKHILLSKIVGSDDYSNDMQQNLFASTKTAFTLGFDCVVPVLLQDAGGTWFIKYDTIHYRDVFPEPGAKDVRTATEVFVRRYLTAGEVRALIENQVAGWDIPALKRLVKAKPPSREAQSASHQDKRRKLIPEGYEIITWYSNTGAPFLTFSAGDKTLLRIEKNKHPLKWHPVHFLILEKDAQQPLGKSQVELLLGRQEFQDLMLNGAMKLWYRNINPSIIGYGTANAIPNLSPGKYTQISNPNAKIEAFEVNTQTLMQYGLITQQNFGSMINNIGAADQQMATQAGNGMSATPQGVEAQQSMVDVTTNNFQKAIESFFSHYCSYALTIYFQELRGASKILPSADTRKKLIAAGIPAEMFNEKGELEMPFEKLAVEYAVKCVPGSLTELEEEKQLRILNGLFVPLSQAMPALASTNNPEALANASAALQFIVQKEIELSGSAHSVELKELFTNGATPHFVEAQQRADALEQSIGSMGAGVLEVIESNASVITALQEQVALIAETQKLLLEKLGVTTAASGADPNTSAPAESVVG